MLGINFDKFFNACEWAAVDVESDYVKAVYPDVVEDTASAEIYRKMDDHHFKMMRFANDFLAWDHSNCNEIINYLMPIVDVLNDETYFKIEMAFRYYLKKSPFPLFGDEYKEIDLECLKDAFYDINNYHCNSDNNYHLN